MKEKTRVCVVIPVKNEEKGLKDLLKMVLSQTSPLDEVIVVDAGSEDKTAEIVKEMSAAESRLQYILEPGAKCGTGRNAGIQSTGAEIIVSLDGGCLISDKWLEPLVDPIIKGNADYVTGNILPMKAEASFSGAKFDFGEIICSSMFWTLRSKDTMAGGASVAFRRSVWEQAGGFDDGLRNGEDILFINRVKNLDVQFAYAENSVAFWQVGPGILDAFQRKVNYTRGNVTLDARMTLVRGILKRSSAVVLLILFSLIFHPFFYLVAGGCILFEIKRVKGSIDRYDARYGKIDGWRGLLLLLIFMKLEAMLIIAEEIGVTMGLWDKFFKRMKPIVKDIRNTKINKRQRSKKIILKLIRPVFRKIEYRVLCISLEDSREKNDLSLNGFLFKKLDQSNLGLVKKKFNQGTALRFETRMNQADCFLVFHNNELCGYGWISSNIVEKQGIEPFVFDVSPPASTIYWFDGYIVPDKRNTGAMTGLLNHLFMVSRKAGHKKGFYLVDMNNHAMAKAAGKVGFKSRGSISYSRYFSHVTKDMSALDKL